jgi:hypothetical protein
VNTGHRPIWKLGHIVGHIWNLGQQRTKIQKFKLTIVQVGISKKCTLKKFSSNSKEENKLKILQFLSNLKEKNVSQEDFLFKIHHKAS